MAQELLRKAGVKRKVAPKKAVGDAPKRIVLVGTYAARQLEKWPGYYNYPLYGKDRIDVETVKCVNELWLFSGAKLPRYFAAECLGVKTREELKEFGYKPSGKGHGSGKYLLFKIKKLYAPSRDFAESVTIRTKDFAGQGATQKQLKAYLESPDRKDPLLAKMLPKIVTELPRERLRVCEAAVQLDLLGDPIVTVEGQVPEMKLVKPTSKDGGHAFTEYKIVDSVRPFLNTIIQGDSAEVLKRIPECSIDLVVTSPPYDQIRDYNGFTLNLHAIGEQLYRVVKPGGVVAMVIQDSTKNFAKTLTSFRTIVDWCDNVGFKMFETVIYHKNGTEGAWWTHRFRVDHEYMPIFFKGDRPSYFNKEPLKIPSKWGGKVMTGSGNRRTSGETTKTVTRPINLMKCRGTVWDYMMAGDKNPLKRKHPAVFPDKIPFDFIQCFCPPDGVVLDPFLGCGSTAVTAKGLGRNYIGIDISAEYCALAEERIRVDSCKYSQQVFPF